MARIRSVKPGFFTSIPIADIPDDSTRLHFIGLWTYADDEGRGVDDARLIKAAVWPLDEKKTVKRIETMQAELHKRGRIIRYEVDGRRYFQITPASWQEHQHVNRPQTSVIPGPEDGKLLPKPDDDTGTITERSVKEHGASDDESRQEGLGGERLGTEGFLASDGTITEPARKPPLAALAEDEPRTSHQNVFDALLAACAVEPEGITDSARGGYGKAASEIRKAGGEPQDVLVRAVVYRTKFPQAALTPSALAKHWAECGEAGASVPTISNGQAALARARLNGGQS